MLSRGAVSVDLMDDVQSSDVNFNMAGTGMMLVICVDQAKDVINNISQDGSFISRQADRIYSIV